MRVHGRIYDELGNATWVVVNTDADGSNDYVYATALTQELKLNLGESPMYGDRGIPAGPSVIKQIAPDYYTMLMQQRYAPFFINVSIARVPQGTPNLGTPSRQPYQLASRQRVPTYSITLVLNNGTILQSVIST